MIIISELIDTLETELDLAKCYTKSYLVYNMNKNSEKERQFSAMAKESLSHAETIYELIQETQEAYTLPEDLRSVLAKKENLYTNQRNWIKNVLE